MNALEALTDQGLADHEHPINQTETTTGSTFRPSQPTRAAKVELRSIVGTRPDIAPWPHVGAQLRDIVRLRPDWDSYGGVAPHQLTVAYAASELGSLIGLGLPEPVVTPSGDGHVLASWSGHGIEVELWFLAPNNAVVLIDDDHGELAPHSGPDPRLINTVQAIRKIKQRA